MKKLYICSMEEIWKDIKGYEGLYEVSNLGNVRRYYKYDKHTYNPHFKVLLIKPNNCGYLNVKLYKNGSYKHFQVHRLVAEAFLPNPDNLPQVNHKDENKVNNSVSNLEWCTAKYNCNYGTHNERSRIGNVGKIVSQETRYKISLSKQGSIAHNRTKIKQINNIGETLNIFDSIKDASLFIGCSPASICDVLKGRSKTCKGYRWEYV